MMIYEFRDYEAMPGKLPALNKRFREVTLGLFQKHGMQVIGFWENVTGTSNHLNYILAYPDLAGRERCWASFQADPEWQRARAESEKEGPLVARVSNTFWRPTDYSPLK